MTGLSICHALLKEHPDLPIVMVTGKGDESITAEALNVGVGNSITKDSPAIFMNILPVIITNLARRAFELKEKTASELALKESVENVQHERKILNDVLGSF